MSLDPNIIRYAKQIYNHLGLSDRISYCSRPSASFPEIDKMKQLLSMTDETVLNEVVKGFLRWTPPRQRKKTISDFISQIDQEISILTKDIFEGSDDELIQTINQIETVSRKRTLDVNDTTETNVKKHKPDTPVTTKLNIPSFPRLECFSSDVSQLNEYNFICSPAKPTKLFSGVCWIVLFEIARFLDNCKVPWDEVPFEAFRTFLDIGASEPRKLFDAMMRWNTEVRLGQKLNGLAYSRMDRCPDSVWSYIQVEKSSVKTQTISEQTPQPSPTSATPSPINTARASSRPGFSIKNDDTATQNYIKQKLLKNRVVRYSAVINFKTINQVPKITLRSPKVSASNRFFRKFGQDRFLEVVLSATSSPSMVIKLKDYILKPFLLMQRVFRFLFIKDNALIFFATEGTDLEPISIQQVIDWHMPIIENWGMSMSKYASRMSLGYSSSIPTIQFEPSEIEYIDDIYSTISTTKDASACMTDGCGIISCAAMREIMGCQATDRLPCAIQGRIAGAKGVWIIAPDLDFNSGKYIKIRKSQDKFKTGLPQADSHLDPHHYTFDLVKNSICIYPSNLNIQFIQVLAAGGVPTKVFVEILGEYLHRLATVVTKNQNVKILRDWVAKVGNIMSRRWESEDQVEKGLWKDLGLEEDVENDLFQGDSDSLEDETKSDSSSTAGKSETGSVPVSSMYDHINKYSGYPSNGHEVVVRLLDSGFDLSNVFVATRISNIFKQLMAPLKSKYKIEIEQSCTVTCIPDPIGILEPDEVYLQLSTRKVDEKTGIRAGLILGDVVVARNPCGLKSDVQKVKAIDCPALRMYTDLIIFSTKGESSLASKLGGGDYDGDLVFCCWDQRIVEPFTASPVVKELERVAQAFEKDKTTVGQQIGSFADTEKALQSHFIKAQMPDGTLGLYENWRTVLAEKSSLDDPDVSYLAQMCARLVDAPKQGLCLKLSAYQRDRTNYSKIPYPTWFMDKKNKKREAQKSFKETSDAYKLPKNSTCVTTMDHLYETLVRETKAFDQYSQNIFTETDMPSKDPDLLAPWSKANEYAMENNDYEFQHDLDLIRKAINANMNAYNKQSSHYGLMRQHMQDTICDPSKIIENDISETQSQFTSFFELEEYISKEFNNSPNPSKFISPIIQHDLLTNKSRMVQSLKASYAYTIMAPKRYNKYCYIVAFDALRRIKSDAYTTATKENGLAETVSVSIYKSLSIDKKWIRKIKDSNVAEYILNSTSS
ncbi:hypothetical protein G6F46_000018 [Rhizopus delemar]|uniref:RNA-dependent RNA polymerase n=2 Tax=Rhizopus TaxID=4842 RepID=A0A9P7CUB7_9FUNG|nr:hypothetical protein G6F55_000017 [Rhizopus delemar]KAG1554141.1 hypothetical protein G6F51_000147 [Rhizopus arrhizus]KAG1528857.1 hypothetical protein G6F52_000263 [Rhizopus delemar]KAG1563448.1 hypothetical protein G6F49_000018 [Rhizopus delemar]KAG1576465.1 hypothetical protein G6F50_000185 [Rhizopus delemar]